MGSGETIVRVSADIFERKRLLSQTEQILTDGCKTVGKDKLGRYQFT